MKITCPYCGNLFNDTLEKCPSCGAPNAGVVRRSGNQPVTIEELKQWYADRGLPPYETTRFFIGVDYRKPRAFGIYQDTKTGNYVVYKNKDNGSRAVRYEGTDEAYAVNELYQRLKEEIIQQKRLQAERGTSKASGSKGRSRDSGSSNKARSPKVKRSLLSRMAAHPVLTVLLLIFLGFVVVIGGLIVADPPRSGYYSYENAVYYAEDSDGSGGNSINTMYWYVYDADAGEWTDSLESGQLPKELEKDGTASAWFVSESWSEDVDAPAREGTLPVPDELETPFTEEDTVDRGYYDYDGTVYYHAVDTAWDGWFFFDTDLQDWDEMPAEELPEDLYLDDTAKDFYYTPTWDEATQITDFADSSAYEEYLQQAEEDEDILNNFFDWDNDNDDDAFDWDWGDTDWDTDWGTDWDTDW